MIIRGGVNIYPAEVEEVLLGVQSIAGAAVVNIEEPEFAEAVAAFVVCEQGAQPTDDDINAYCGKQMENHRVLVAILPIEEIPRTLLERL